MKEVLFLLILVAVKCASSSNILVLESIPSPSHHIWLTSLTKELALKGHNITTIAADIDSTKTKNIHYLHLNGVYEAVYNESGVLDTDYIKMGNVNPWIMMGVMHSFSISMCKNMIKSNGYQQLLNYPDDFKFDLIMHDFLSHPCLLPFMHKFNYPSLISLTALGGAIPLTATLVGSTFSSHIPFYFHTNLDDTFLWKVNNYLLYITDYLMRIFVFDYSYDKIVKAYFPGIPKLREIERMTKLVLLNTHPLYETAEPMLPNVIPVGAMQVKNPKPLPKEIESILDSSPNGIIYFALGTNMRSDKLGDVRLVQILEAFKSLPQYTFLWKFESDKLPVDVPKNVHIRAWFPQNDLLANPKVKLFISHCGLLSTQEAIWHNVPILGVPIMVDQFLNLKKSIELGIAEGYSIRDLNNVTFAESIRHARENKMLTADMNRFSKSYRDQPETPMDRAVWWTEWLLRNPDSASYLRNPAMDFNVFQRQSIDIIAFLTVLALMGFCLSFKIIKCVVNRSSNMTKKNKKKTN